MKGPFGMLLIGGGIILIIGLFTGKIQFPGVSGSNSGNGSAGGTAGQAFIDSKGIVQPQTGTGIGNSTTAVQVPAKNKQGTKVCPPGYDMSPAGFCVRRGAIKNTSSDGANTTQVCFTIPFTSQQVCLPNI